MILVSYEISADEYWQNHPELHDIPIYYASSLAKKCMAVYQTYVNAMNDKIRKQININNPFVFKHISNLKVRASGRGRGWGLHAGTSVRAAGRVCPSFLLLPCHQSLPLAWAGVAQKSDIELLAFLWRKYSLLSVPSAHTVSVFTVAEQLDRFVTETESPGKNMSCVTYFSFLLTPNHILMISSINSYVKMFMFTFLEHSIKSYFLLKCIYCFVQINLIIIKRIPQML